MDDLLDLNWSSPTSSTAQKHTPQPQKPRDAFSDLLNTNTAPKPVDISKLSLLEQQRMKQQQQQQQPSSASGSPWLTPIQATTPNSSTTPKYSPSATPPPPVAPTTCFLGQTSTTSTTSSSFEDLLNPFGANSKKVNQDRSTPLNQLRNQHSSIPNSESSSQWDFDLLDSKLNNTKTTRDTPTNSHTPSLDPFDMDSLAAQDTRNFASPSPQPPSNNDEEEEDDNPLGILAGPARPKESTPPPPPSPPIQQQSSPIQYNSNSPSVTHGRIMLSEDEEDEMMAQLIDMGFSLQESKFAIEATGGNDVQAAIDLLVQNSEVAQRRQPTDQHGTAQQQKAELSQNERARNALFSDDSAPRLSSSSQSHPQQQKQRKQRKQQQHPQEASQKNTTAAEGDDTLHHQAEKVVMQAQELGGFLYKNATSFLKTGREKVTKAVGDWQEQQREQRLRQMQEEQGGPVRPKWMNGGDETVDVSTNNIEKFADDEDSDNEQDIEAERRKIQEMRRLQELKRREQAAAAHKARQQQNLRKETLIAEEEVYISPSRRRGNTPSSSGKSTPRSNGSPVPQPQQIQQQQKSNLAPKQQQQQQQYKPSQQPNAISVTPGENKRTRPVVNASADIMAKANEARNQGNEKFKLGQFGEAEEAYTRAIEILPAGHDHQVLLCNNRAMARLKIGNYKKCAEDCDTAIKLAKKSGDGSSNSEGVVIQWRDQIIKSLYRKAEALENIEKYKDALSTYDELVKYEGTGNSKINQGMSRCRQALNPKKVNAPPKSATPTPPPQQQKKEDFMSMFDPSAAKSFSSPVTIPTVSADELSKSKAVAAMRAKAAEQEAEDAEKLEKTDDVNARLLAWKAGKEQNLRALLATLDTLLWPGAQWKGAQMSELINLKKCKITYMKAIGKVHPDKLPSDVTVEQRMLAGGIFASLNEAWDSFKCQNQM